TRPAAIGAAPSGVRDCVPYGGRRRGGGQFPGPGQAARAVRGEVPVGEAETEAVIKIGVAFGRGDDEPEYGREEIDDAHAQGDDAHRAPEGGRSGERGDPLVATAPFH